MSDMKTKSEGYKGATFEDVMKYFRILMALLYVAAGVAVMLRPTDSLNISTKYSFPLGALLIAYGLFRTYKLFKK